MAEQSPPDPYLEHLDFLVSSFTDNGKSLRGFVSNPQELSISILTAGLLANSKLIASLTILYLPIKTLLYKVETY